MQYLIKFIKITNFPRVLTEQSKAHKRRGKKEEQHEKLADMNNIQRHYYTLAPCTERIQWHEDA
jgi:hypothetical protein